MAIKNIKNLRRGKLEALLSSDPQDYEFRGIAGNSSPVSGLSSIVYYSNPSSSADSSPNVIAASPWSQPSPYVKSPWVQYELGAENFRLNGLIGSLFREEGHVYSLAAAGDLLYTGSESKNIRVWKDLHDFSGFKSSSGLVKAIIVHGDKIFTGHQDGKIRVWRSPGGEKNTYKRVGNLPTTRELWRKSINPRNYVEVRRNRNIPWIKHFDAVSCLSVDFDQGLLYSGSWDRTFKVWRISDSKCLESVHAHDDAINSVAVGFDGLIFTASADGTVKAWRRELLGKHMKHVLVETLLKQQHALTSLAVNHTVGVVYAGSSDGLVTFWEREKHFMSYGSVLRGHKMAVLCLAVGGRLIVSGSADASICVWRREVGGVHTCTAVLTGHDGPVKCLAMKQDMSSSTFAAPAEDDQMIVYSGSLDKTVKVWRVSERSQ